MLTVWDIIGYYMVGFRFAGLLAAFITAAAAAVVLFTPVQVIVRYHDAACSWWSPSP